MNGFFNINKPFGISSAKVVWQIKKKFNLKAKIGHMGTLDPFATGVLVVGIGKANRLFNAMLKKRKTYVAVFEFGYQTDTLDLESENIVKRSEVIPKIADILKVIPTFVGKSSQVAPDFSAKKVNGTRAYMLARSGEIADIKPHNIEIFRLDLLGQVSETAFKFEIECSAGTYIRSLGRDLSEKLGTVGTMIKLERTKCGEFDIANSQTVENLEWSDLVGCDLVIPHLNKLELNITQIQKIKNGQKLQIESSDGIFKVFDGDTIIGLAKVENGFVTMPTWLV